MQKLKDLLDIKRADKYPLRRRAVVKELLRDREKMLVVAGLGAPNWDCTAAGDHPLTFPLWGAMGGASMIGLGLALAQPSWRVLVITGDAEMLMGLGSLVTIAVQNPANLAIVVCDNERYGETGMQATATAGNVDLSKAAEAAGFSVAGTISSENEFGAALPIIRDSEGPVFYTIKIKAEELPFVMPPKDGVTLKDRFRVALLGEAEALGVVRN